MSTDEQNNNISSQTDNKNLVPEDSDNKLLANLFNILRSQNSDKVKATNNNENILLNDEEDDGDNEDEEDDEEDDDDDDEEDDEEDVRWDAISKLLDSHLQISKAFLHLVKSK